jgi:cytochrome P450
MLPHWLSRTYRQSLVMAHELERIGLKMIAHKREVLTQSDDVFATLLEMRDADTGEALTNAELIGHMTILFVAGHESTRNTLTWTLLLLAQHPRILQALYDELHVKLNGAPPTLEQLNQLSLLEAVIKEAMRLMPTTPYITRRVIAETELGGQHLPPETIVVISPYVTHRSAELYANPQRFQPERWFDLSPSAYEFLPFGAGGRMCVAAVFGMMELKIILSILLQRHWFKIKDGAQIDRHVGVTMGSKHGLPVRVEPVGTKITPSKLTGHIHQMVLMED